MELEQLKTNHNRPILIKQQQEKLFSLSADADV